MDIPGRPDTGKPAPIQPRTDQPGQDPLINPAYHPIPQDQPATREPDGDKGRVPTAPARKD